MIAILSLVEGSFTVYQAVTVPDPARLDSIKNIRAYGDAAAGRPILSIEYPKQAISIRQPWVHAIEHLGKDVENRSRRMCRPGWYFLHAGLNVSSHVPAVEFITGIYENAIIPKPADLKYGGVVGAFKLGEWLTESPSRWFVGPLAVQILAFVPLAFQAGSGGQGVFAWDHERAF